MESHSRFHDDQKAALLSELSQSNAETNRPINNCSRRRRVSPFAFFLAFIISGWVLLHFVKYVIHATPQYPSREPHPKESYEFEDITPSEKLEWYPCFVNNFCARLTVPMDYHRPLNESKDNPKVHLALLMAPGKHPMGEKNSKSPLLINPGGPGGSGTMAAMGFGSYIQRVVGEDQDVIGFDPRGIGATVPRADCFSFPINNDSDEEDQGRGYFNRLMWQLQGAEVGLVNSSSDALAKIDMRARGVAKLCEDKDALKEKDSIFRYAHTPSVARDMISIIDAWDEWSDSKPTCHRVSELSVLSKDEARNAATLDTKGKLVYWGFSYGTLLGATFASMFPDRVGRMVLDGVVHADHYVAPIWADSIQDADAIMDSFSGYCYKGKDRCALYHDGDSVEDIFNRFQAVMDRYKQSPSVFANPRTRTPFMITYSDLRMILFSTLYAPTSTWPMIATIIDLLSKGQDEILAGLGSIPDPGFICNAALPYWAYPSDAQDAIMCSDKRYALNETLPNLEERFEQMSNLSSFADVWMSVMVGCDGYSIEAIDPPMRWDDHPAHKQKPIKTSFPVLFVSNTHDPVTPLSAGVAMARKFVDSGIIEQRSEGHCSLAAVSKCTINWLRAYFILGQVPAHPSKLEDGDWEKCDADEWPFHPYEGDPILAASEEEKHEIITMLSHKKAQESANDLGFWDQSRRNSKLDISRIARGIETF